LCARREIKTEQDNGGKEEKMALHEVS